MITLYRAQLGKPGVTGIDVTVRACIMGASPTWKYVCGLKNGSITQEEYEHWYRNQLDTYADEVVAWVCRQHKDVITFLCFCKDGAFCHTYILIDWLVKRRPDLFVSGV